MCTKNYKMCVRCINFYFLKLRKIDKVISMLEMQKSEGTDITPDDLQKLEKLTQERVEVCSTKLLISCKLIHYFKVSKACKNKNNNIRQRYESKNTFV